MEEKIFNNLFSDIYPLLLVPIEQRTDDYYINIQNKLNKKYNKDDNINEFKLKWNSIDCGRETFERKDILGRLESYLHHDNKKVWIILILFVFIFMFLPYILVQKQYKTGIYMIDKIVDSTAMDANDIIIVFINIVLFSLLTLFLFTEYLSKDIEIIASNNTNLYINIIKNDIILKNIVIEFIDKIIETHKDEYEKYKNWKNVCNNNYINRSFKFTYLLCGFILLIFFLDKYLGKSHIHLLSKDFLKSILFICIVFSTELFMLYFVFLKIHVIGEVDLNYKVLNSIIKKL